MKLPDLKNKHESQDVYVIGSGPSLDFMDATFFENKIVVCINYTIEYVKKAQHIYLVSKEPGSNMQRLVKKRGATLVTCKHHSGVPKNKLNNIEHPDLTVIFDPRPGSIKNKNQTTQLERSSSSLVTGLHLAAFMGAKNIILVGHDCGTINGKVHYTGYIKSDSVIKEGRYGNWMRHKKVQDKTLAIKKDLQEIWGCNVHSLNPFVNLGLEGNTFKSFY